MVSLSCPPEYINEHCTLFGARRTRKYIVQHLRMVCSCSTDPAPQISQPYADGLDQRTHGVSGEKPQSEPLASTPLRQEIHQVDLDRILYFTIYEYVSVFRLPWLCIACLPRNGLPVCMRERRLPSSLSLAMVPPTNSSSSALAF